MIIFILFSKRSSLLLTKHPDDKKLLFLEEILDSKKFNLLFRPLICLVTFWARLLGSVRRYLCTNVHFNMTYKFYRIRYDIMTNKCCGHRLVFQP